MGVIIQNRRRVVVPAKKEQNKYVKQAMGFAKGKGKKTYSNYFKKVSKRMYG